MISYIRGDLPLRQRNTTLPNLAKYAENESKNTSNDGARWWFEEKLTLSARLTVKTEMTNSYPVNTTQEQTDILSLGLQELALPKFAFKKLALPKFGALGLQGRNIPRKYDFNRT
jgi:hypothetical protein